MVKTWLTERFGLAVPVISAPMAAVSGGRLAAAVSAAGGLGMVGLSSGGPADVEREASLAATSGRPFGVGLLAWSLHKHPGLFDAVLECGASLVSVSFGDVMPYVDRIREAGLVSVTQVGTVDDARVARDAGIEVLVARGGEGGGHGRNAVATLPLLQAVLDEVDAPVVAAGGVATARGLAAVLAAGAAGAWVGTAFLACPEADNTAAARAAVVGADLTDTTYTTVLDIGRDVPWPSEFGGRAVRNSFAERWHGRESELARVREPLDEPVVWAGQGVGLVRRVRPAAEVVADFGEAERYLRDTAGRLE